MITNEMINEATRLIERDWADSAKAVIDACNEVEPFGAGGSDFVKNHCVACGGNWGGMLLSGIQKLYPKVWDAIPDNMGHEPFGKICSVLILCGVDTSI